jgi:hypothetical protein
MPLAHNTRHLDGVGAVGPTSRIDQSVWQRRSGGGSGDNAAVSSRQTATCSRVVQADADHHAHAAAEVRAVKHVVNRGGLA